jgi:hypothetical protein
MALSVECDAGTPAELARLKGGEHPERRIAAVEQQQAARFEGCKMLDQKLALVPLVGSDDGIKDEAVERVVDLGDPRQGGGITVGGKHLAELGDRLWRVGQAHRRSIDGAQVEPAPPPNRSIVVPAPDEMAVQLDERSGIELLPGGAERAFCDDTLGHIARAQDLKELIQLALERAFDQVDQEHDHDGERQGTVTGKVCFGAPVPGNEGRIADEIT